MRARAVVVAHRSAMVAEGIAAGLATFPAIVPVAAVTSAAQVEQYGERAEAVALDGAFPNAEAAARRLRAKGLRVVLIGEGGDGEDGVRVSPRASIGALAAALVPEARSRNGDASSSARRLTLRELEILRLVARGMAAKQVARFLGISSKTVELHKSHIFAKLGVPNQTAAVSLLARQALGRSGPWSPSSI